MTVQRLFLQNFSVGAWGSRWKHGTLMDLAFRVPRFVMKRKSRGLFCSLQTQENSKFVTSRET